MGSKQTSSGFTIVELLIVIIVIGILATLILVGYNNASSNAKVTTLKGDLVQAAKQLNIDRERMSGGATFPASLAAANNGNGINSSSNNTFVYDVSGSAPTSFCLADTNGTTTYYVTSTSVTPQVGGCPIISGLAGWWKFNGDTTDSSGNGDTATNVGATLTTGQNGTANSAYSFNGTSAYLQLPSNAVLAPTDNFTVSAWINLNASAGTSIWNHIMAGASNDWGFGVNMDASGNGPIQLTRVSYADFSADTTPVSRQAWHQVGVSYSAGTVRYYKDGVLTSTVVNTTNPFTAPGTKRIGNGGAYNAFFHGTIDDVRLYSRVVSTSEFQSIYAAGAQ